ncbi:GDP-mannose transporter GONST4-like [Gossypium australe]|uniref:GDP-mannose transporter GONST4-like n=1 Tax=Gossypium australe TaxID=47621 RepID=A0A5B6VH27_9ROSI|nr:GDP-mannose transporter GONST4-like [Gossypium australe]
MFATPIGLVCLLFTLAGGVLYQQSVTEPKPTPPVREHDMTESARRQHGSAKRSSLYEIHRCCDQHIAVHRLTIAELFCHWSWEFVGSFSHEQLSYRSTTADLASFAICSEISEMYLAAFGRHEIPLSPRIKPGYYNLYAEKPLNVVIYIVETRLTPLEKSAKCCQLGAGRYLNGFGSEGFVS